MRERLSQWAGAVDGHFILMNQPPEQPQVSRPNWEHLCPKVEPCTNDLQWQSPIAPRANVTTGGVVWQVKHLVFTSYIQTFFFRAVPTLSQRPLHATSFCNRHEQFARDIRWFAFVQLAPSICAMCFYQGERRHSWHNTLTLHRVNIPDNKTEKKRKLLTCARALSASCAVRKVTNPYLRWKNIVTNIIRRKYI